MIQRYFNGYGGIEPDNELGEYVLYEDHLKEVESLKIDKEILESVKEDHKLIKEIIASAKPKWLPGPPTTTGWHWLKFNDNSKLIYECNGRIPTRYSYKYVDNMVVKSGLIVTHHCPIQEPEE